MGLDVVQILQKNHIFALYYRYKQSIIKKQLSFLLACTLLQVWPATFADGYSSNEEDLYEEEEAPKGTMSHLNNIGAYIALDLVVVAVLSFLAGVVNYSLVSWGIIKSGKKALYVIIYGHMFIGLMLGLVSTLISGIVGIWVSNIVQIITGGSIVAILGLGLFGLLKPNNGGGYFLVTIIPIVSMLGILFATWAIHTEKGRYFLHGSSVVEKDEEEDFGFFRKVETQIFFEKIICVSSK